MTNNKKHDDILNDKSDPRGVWVPWCLIVNTNITHAERMILAMILQMYRKTGLVYFTNPDFADELALGESTVKKRIPDLERRGYITITEERYKAKNGRWYPRRVLTPLPLTCEGGTEKELGGSSILTSQKFQNGTEIVPKRNEGSSEKVQPTNSIINKNIKDRQTDRACVDSVSQSLNSFLPREQPTEPREDEERSELTPGALDYVEQHREPSDPNETTVTAEPTVIVRPATLHEVAVTAEPTVIVRPVTPHEDVVPTEPSVTVNPIAPNEATVPTEPTIIVEPVAPNKDADKPVERVPLRKEDIVLTYASDGSSDPATVQGNEPIGIATFVEQVMTPVAPVRPPRPVNPDGLDPFRDCLAQIATLMTPRTWNKYIQGSSPAEYEAIALERPGIGVVTQAEVDQLIELSRTECPDVDPIAGAVHILRACASTEDGLQKLQNTSFKTKTLRIGAFLRIGGKDDPLAFLRERIPSTPPLQHFGIPDPDVVAALRTSVGGVYADNTWDSAWADVAVACAASGCDPATFMGYALELAGDAPVLWVTSSVTMDYVVERVAEAEATSRAAMLEFNRVWAEGGVIVTEEQSAENLDAFRTLLRCLSLGHELPAWFYVLAPTAFDEKVFNMWGDDARVEFTRSTELRAFAREVVPDRFSALEAKWSRFYDSPVSVPVYPTPCSATRVITGVDVTDDGDAPVAEDTTDFASALELKSIREWVGECDSIVEITLDAPPKPVTVSSATPATPG